MNGMKMTTKEAAAYLGLSPLYLRNMRALMHEHNGPEHSKEMTANSRMAYHYDQAELDRWAETHKWRKARITPV